jgi:DNA repair exonuclease SbcCD ATPase subunit
MDTKGVMQQIREHLAQGKSSQEVIALGYAPGSVYKVQRQLRLSSGDEQQVSAQPAPEPQVSVVDIEALARMQRLETENAQLPTQMAELYQEVERVTSLRYQLDQFQQRCEGLGTKVGRMQEESSQYAQEQQHRIETLERQVQRLDEIVRLLGLLTYHLDVHHRQVTHSWPPDPADWDLQPTDEGYRTLQQQLRQCLAEAMADMNQRQRFGLPIRLKNLAQDIHHQQLLPRLTYLNRQPKP